GHAEAALLQVRPGTRNGHHDRSQQGSRRNARAPASHHRQVFWPEGGGVMSILVVGSVAFDTIKSPSGSVEKELGGAATYFGICASHFTEVRIVAVVGADFGPEQEAVFCKRNIDLRGLQRSSGKTFHWGGEYGEN